eukprot:5052289-Prymnesium_polylepis.1
MATLSRLPWRQRARLTWRGSWPSRHRWLERAVPSSNSVAREAPAEAGRYWTLGQASWRGVMVLFSKALCKRAAMAARLGQEGVCCPATQTPLL